MTLMTTEIQNHTVPQSGRRSRTILLDQFVLILMACFASVGVAQGEDERTAVNVQLQAGPADRENVPIICVVPDGLRHAASWELVRSDSGAAVPVQKLTGDPARCAWILEQKLPAGEARQYQLRADTGAGQPETVICHDNGAQLQLKVKEKPILSYHHETAMPPAELDPVYARSGFIHPLVSPAGRVLTDDFPPDHAHQHGIFTAWVNTTLGDRKIDFWNQPGRTGNVRHKSIVRTASGPVFAEFEVVLEHVALNDGKDQPVLEETWIVRAYNTTDAYLVDFESTQRCVANMPLILNEYHYGGFGFRGNRAWSQDSPFDFLTNEGLTRADGNHARAQWLAAHGPVDDGVAYAAVLCHPDNVRAPQPARLHPSMPYFSYSPVVLGEMKLSPGETYVTRLRFVAADGQPQAARIDQLFEDYARPPVVKIKK